MKLLFAAVVVGLCFAARSADAAGETLVTQGTSNEEVRMDYDPGLAIGDIMQDLTTKKLMIVKFELGKLGDLRNIIDQLHQGLGDTNVILIRGGGTYDRDAKGVRELAVQNGYAVEETVDSDAIAEFAFRKIVEGKNLKIRG